MRKLRIATVVGARPQFVKAAPVSAALRADGHEEILVHTGQHYDYRMSAIFFREMGIAEPDFNLSIGSGLHGYQTGQILIKIEELMVKLKPDLTIVYGDTNSTLAGALAAAKLRIPLCHIESGLRSYNREMPEEHNRVLTDHCSDLLFCPTQRAVENLKVEAITRGVHLAGDTMFDAVRQFAPFARTRSTALQSLGLVRGSYVLATAHRPSNVNNPQILKNILDGLDALHTTVVFSVHPRTRGTLTSLDANYGARWRNILFLDPFGYLDMLALEESAGAIVTDSGGIQKEAFLLKVPCVTLRRETEWPETVESGWNILTDPSEAAIGDAIQSLHPLSHPAVFGDGNAAQYISKTVTTWLN